MTEELVQHLGLFFGSGSVAEMEFSTGDFRLMLKRPSAAGRAMALKQSKAQVGIPVAQPVALHVKSPASGRFVRVHPLTAEIALVEGASISAGDMLGFLEVDGVLSGVCATVTGRIMRIEVPDGALAGFDTSLFSIVPQALPSAWNGDSV